MLSSFRLPWCSEQQPAHHPHQMHNPNMMMKQQQRMAVDNGGKLMNYSNMSAEMPMFGKFKRQLPDSDSASAPLVKKPRLEVETSPRVASPVAPAIQLKVATAPSVGTPVAAPARVQELPATPAATPKIVKTAEKLKDMPKPSSAAPAVQKPVPVTTAPPMLDCIDNLTPLQQIITNEFNMAMLMKNNELRLIELELAKCQVALEQLRRCEIRPYPGYDCPSATVTEGTGPAVAPPADHSRPAHPAPHGVLEGPYARHYRQWLLRDPDFDAYPLAQLHGHHALDNPYSISGRSTRNHGTVRKSISSRTHAVTSLPASALNSPTTPLHHAPPAPRDKSAPLVLRRSTDNQLVKLICNNCLRGNFSSIQGFLNHCRIAHKVDYKSHDLAAIDCGRLLDDSDRAKLSPELLASGPTTTASAGAGAGKASKSGKGQSARSSVPGKTIPIAAPMWSPAPTALQTPLTSSCKEGKSFPFEASATAVHPLNSPQAALPTPPASVVKKPAAPVLRIAPPAQSQSSAPLKAASGLPRLSAHFAKHAHGGDLAAALAAAREPVDFSSPAFYVSTPVSDEEEGDEMDMDSPAISSVQGFQRKMQAPLPSPLRVSSPLTHVSPSAISPVASTPGDGNPGLVSDHEEDGVSLISEDDDIHHTHPHHPVFIRGDSELAHDDHRMMDVDADVALGLIAEDRSCDASGAQ